MHACLYVDIYVSLRIDDNMGMRMLLGEGYLYLQIFMGGLVKDLD
jgi:hypothetical protein